MLVVPGWMVRSKIHADKETSRILLAEGGNTPSVKPTRQANVYGDSSKGKLVKCDGTRHELSFGRAQMQHVLGGLFYTGVNK